MGKNHASQYANFGSLQHEGMGKNHASQYANFGSLQHNLSSFKFSTKVWERTMLVNTPILEAYKR